MSPPFTHNLSFKGKVIKDFKMAPQSTGLCPCTGAATRLRSPLSEALPSQVQNPEPCFHRPRPNAQHPFSVPRQAAGCLDAAVPALTSSPELTCCPWVCSVVFAAFLKMPPNLTISTSEAQPRRQSRWVCLLPIFTAQGLC